jgi:glycogen operon protein
VLDLRDRLRRAMMATLLLSQGTPMILMGDEVGRTQGGNNNAYCQDNAMNWLRLDGLGPRDAAFLDFVRDVVALRRSRPLFRLPTFLHDRPGARTAEVVWLRPDGEVMQESDWHPEARSLGMQLRDRAGQVLMLFNSHFEPVKFRLPPADWRLLVDTAAGERRLGGQPGAAASPISVAARALLVLEAARRDPAG